MMISKPSHIALVLAATSYATAAQIQSSQPRPDSEPFIGEPWQARPLRPKTRYPPDSLALHHDTGNTRSVDYPGPLGHNLTLKTSDVTTPGPMLFDPNGQLTAGATCGDSHTTCVVSMDPNTFDMLDKWLLPDNVMFNTLTYSTKTGNSILLPGNGSLYELERQGDSIDLKREFNGTELLGAEGGLGSFMYDGNGNLWYTNGAQQGAGVGKGITKAVIGYVDPNGQHYSLTLEDQVIENSLGISGSMVYMVTGPAGAADTKNATGTFYALRAGDREVEIVYSAEYDAGDGIKPKAFTRGSGSSPNLLGNKYVAITDNANEQINLLVYEQVQEGKVPSNKPVCSVPLFTPGTSSLDATFVNHFDGITYSIVATNCYNQPTPWFANAGLDINGDWNDFSQMGAGLTRIDITPHDDGTVDCDVKWNDPTSKVTGINTLSTRTGLLYNYYQDLELAREGHYVWYMTARDWESGMEVWRSKVGAGGRFNNNYQSVTLAPDGCAWIMVVGGVVKVCDGE